MQVAKPTPPKAALQPVATPAVKASQQRLCRSIWQEKPLFARGSREGAADAKAAKALTRRSLNCMIREAVWKDKKSKGMRKAEYKMFLVWVSKLDSRPDED